MDNDQPSSMLHVRASTLYPLPETCHTLPFNLLCGEAVNHSGNSSDGLLALTNYRLYLQNGDRQHHIPLGLIELVEVRDMFYLHIGCKDARSYRYKKILLTFQLKQYYYLLIKLKDILIVIVKQG